MSISKAQTSDVPLRTSNFTRSRTRIACYKLHKFESLKIDASTDEPFWDVPQNQMSSILTWQIVGDG